MTVNSLSTSSAARCACSCLAAAAAVLASLLTVACSSSTQPPALPATTFSRTYVGEFLEMTSLEVHPDGGYVAVGLKQPPHSDRSWIMRLDADGGVLWARMDPDARGWLVHVHVVASGDIVAMGYILDTPSFGTVARMVCFAPDGSVRWQKTFHFFGNDMFHDFAVETNGETLLASGSSYPRSSQGTQYVSWVARLGRNGDVLWTRRFPDSVEVWMVAPSGDGYVGLTNGGVVRLNAAGDPTWQRKLGGDLTEPTFRLRPTPDGGMVLLGGTYLEDGMTVVKLDAAGRLDWRYAYVSATGGVYPIDLQVGADGGLVIIASHSAPYPTPGFGILTKLNAAGGLEWQRTVTPGALLVASPDGGYAVGANGDANGGLRSIEIDKVDAGGTLPGCNGADLSVLHATALNVEVSPVVPMTAMPFNAASTFDGTAMVEMPVTSAATCRLSR